MKNHLISMAVYLLMVILVAVDRCASQSISLLDYVTPHDCSHQQYYDSSHLRCVPCPNGTVSSPNHLNCQCPIGFANTPTGCQQCTNGKVVSADGHFCIECIGSSERTSATDANGRCGSCPPGDYTIVSVSSQDTLSSHKCKQCPEGTFVSSNQLYCVPCDSLHIKSCKCRRGACNSTNDVVRGPSLYSIQLEDGREVVSEYIQDNVNDAYRGCALKDQRACQLLANLCVLQNYRLKPKSACTLYDDIYNKDRYNPWREGMPWLFYYNTDTSVELTRASAIPASFTFDRSLSNSLLDVLLVQYSLNGTYLGMQALSDSHLRMCSTGKHSIPFGAKYYRQCHVSTRTLITANPTPVFTEFYLRFTNDQQVKQLYAMPILDESIRRNGQFVNRLHRDDMAKWVLTRRCYFVDAVTMSRGVHNSTSTYFRYPTLISIEIQIQARTNGRIMPPYVRIAHAEVEESVYGALPTEFAVNYFMDGTKHAKDLEITMSVLGALSVIWAAFSAYSWGRRAGKMIADVSTLCKLVLFECAILGDVFLVVITSTALFITFGYKAQELPYYVMLSRDQEWTFVAYLISATVLKLLAMVHKSVHLMLTKTFFIDWERPQPTVVSDTQQPPTADLSHSLFSPTPVVIWFVILLMSIEEYRILKLVYASNGKRRTYLVANEWNELQNYRKTSIAVQMVTMLVLLEGLNLHNWAVVAPGFSLDEQIPPYAESRFSRFAINSGLYLAIAMVQWVFHVLIIERVVVDPFHAIMDLCSIANISVLSLTHPLYGYYIHGRSVHGRADTDMAHMNQYLQNERDNLCGQRGLEPGSELQTFVVSLPKGFRERFDDIVAKASNSTMQAVRLAGADATTAKIHRVAQIHDDINQFLMEFVEHSNAQADYVVRDPSFLEGALDLEFNDTTQIGSFARDKSEMAFSRAFVYGNEWSYLSFELLLFNCIDLATANTSLSAFVTFAVSTIFRKLSSTFFTNNLVKSSFVDQRFLF